MPFWNPEDLRSLELMTSREQLVNAALALVRQLDMDFLAVCIRSRHATFTPSVEMFNNYPEEWNQHYDREKYLLIDPVMEHCSRSLMPLLWEEEVFRKAPHFRAHSLQFGLRHGWSQSMHDARGNESILSVARAHGPIGMCEFYEKIGQTSWLCSVLHTLMVDKLHPHAAKPAPLTKREVEVLTWTAKGKTSEEVACILQLSKSTVNFHVNRCKEKLNASNKAGAVAIATSRGLV